MKDNKHIQSFNEHQENLNISDVSDSDFILNEIKTILKNKEEEMLWYIKEYFTRSETDRHSENLLRMVGGYEGDIASIRMKLIARNP